MNIFLSSLTIASIVLCLAIAIPGSVAGEGGHEHDPMLCRDTQCSSRESSSFPAMISSTIEKNDLVVYLGDSVLDRLLLCLQLVGHEGNVIGIEFNNQRFARLVESIHEHHYENNTLLLNSKLTNAIHDVAAFDSSLLAHCYSRSNSNAMTADCTRFLQLSLSRVYDIIGQICPSQIIFGSSVENDIEPLEKMWILTGLLSGSRLIKVCKPTVMIEDVSSKNSQALIEYLEGHEYHEIHWLLSPNKTNQDIKDVTVSIIASSSKRSMKHATSEMWRDVLIPYVQGEYYLHELAPTFSTSVDGWIPHCVDFTLPPCHNYERKHYSFVDQKAIEILNESYLPKFHPNITERINDSSITTEIQLQSLLYSWKADSSTSTIAHIYQSFEEIAERQSNDDVSFILHWHPRISPSIEPGDAVHSIATTHCHHWILSLYEQIIIAEDVGSNKPRYHEVEVHDDRLYLLLQETSEIENLIEACIAATVKQFQLIHNSQIHAYQHLGDGPVIKPYIQSSSSLNITQTKPFDFKLIEDGCLEPIWCSHLQEMQRRIHAWQFPDDPASALGDLDHHQHPSLKRTCANSKYLLYEPVSMHHGIGSIIEQLASAFRFAICANRILVLDHPNYSSATFLKWRYPGCRGSMMECYFQSIHGCEEELSAEEYEHAAVLDAGKFINDYPHRDTRILRLHGLPSYGSCALCGSSWEESSCSSPFFDGLAINRDPTNPSSAATKAPVDARTNHLPHMGAMMTTIKLPWIAQFIRYIFRPQPWFARHLRRIAQASLIGPKNESVSSIDRPFLSLHVRYGMKVLEESLRPLQKYINAMNSKYPHIQNIFVSTETESVIETLRR
jgi:hypothetical protein